MTDNILILAAAVTTFVKVVVDIIRLAISPLPNWLSPVLALVFGPVFAILLMVATATAITQQTGAQAILAGVLGAGAAVGVTELTRKVL